MSVSVSVGVRSVRMYAFVCACEAKSCLAD